MRVGRVVQDDVPADEWSGLVAYLVDGTRDREIRTGAISAVAGETWLARPMGWSGTHAGSLRPERVDGVRMDRIETRRHACRAGENDEKTWPHQNVSSKLVVAIELQRVAT